MKTNLKTKASAFEGVTHEGAPARRIDDLAKLRRSVMSCLLWEQEFYEDGTEIAKRIVDLVGKVTPSSVATLAVQARTQFGLRHVPLLLTAALCKHASGTRLISDTVPLVVQRADELGELVAIYQKLNGKQAPLSKQLKLGLAKAFAKFDEYQLAKYDRDGDVKLRDVMFLTHPKPAAGRKMLYKRLAERELKTPDTWEVELSGGADKKATFERLILEGKLGYLALLRNLRNMEQAGCSRDLVRGAILARKGGAEKVFPFRYIAAARAAPSFEPALDQALSEAIAEIPPFSGQTIVLVDISPSMNAKLSSKSDLARVDAAAALAAIIPGDVRVFAFTEDVREVPARRGMAGVDAIKRALIPNGTMLGKALRHVNAIKHDRLIVITDEQSQDAVGAPAAKRAYMINVASARNGVGYGPDWVHITGFSENVLRYIREHELG